MTRPTTRAPRRHRPVAHGTTRRGAAMPFALLILVVLGLLTLGGFTAAQQTFRGGRNTLIEQRAFNVAEFGLNQAMAEWRRASNLPANAGGAPIGSVSPATIWVAQGDTASVRVTRLSPMIYWIESVGRANIPNPQLQSVRTASAFVRLAYPTIQPKGAVTAGGDVMIHGSANVDGSDYVPFAWNPDQAWPDSVCTGMRGSTVPAVVVPPGARVNTQPGSILSSPAVQRDASAADSNTYVRYGTESWNSLAANAMQLPGGTYGSDIYPTDSTGTCWTGNPSILNWGEPWRGAASVTSCQNYFPIIYIDGDLVLNGRGRGQGILLVNGDLRINGTFDFAGLIVVRDDIDQGNGTATITGAVMSRNVNLADQGSVWSGTQQVRYSKCAVESALRGSAILVRARDRAWAQLY